MTHLPPDTDGLSMFWWASCHPPADPTMSFAGKTILITGANAGLGFEAALKFAVLNASRLILGVRSLERGKDAKADICRRTGYTPSNIALYHLDMSTFESVRYFMDNINAQEELIDVAILNAGVCAATYTLSPDRFEMSLQVNVLSTALLGVLLLPKLRETAVKTGVPSHMELMSSVAHHDVTLAALNIDKSDNIIEKVSSKDFFSVRTQYNVNKLLLMYVAEALVQATTSPVDSQHYVMVNTVCPWLCRSNLGRDFSLLAKIPVWIFQRIFARTAEQGSRSIVSGVTLGEDGHGAFWSHDTFFRKGDLVTSSKGRELQARVWAEVKRILEGQIDNMGECLDGR